MANYNLPNMNSISYRGNYMLGYTQLVKTKYRTEDEYLRSGLTPQLLSLVQAKMEPSSAPHTGKGFIGKEIVNLDLALDMLDLLDLDSDPNMADPRDGIFIE